MIKTIIFDMDGVVVNVDFEAIYKDFSQRLGIPAGFVSNYHKIHLNDLLLGNIPIEQFWRGIGVADRDGDVDVEQVWIAEGLKHYRANEELLDLIQELKKHYTVGALTNISASRALIDNAKGIYQHFDYSVLSCIERAMKPDLAFYHKALLRASVMPEEAIFIDDKAQHVRAAGRLGIHGIVYTYPDTAALTNTLANLNVLH